MTVSKIVERKTCSTHPTPFARTRRKKIRALTVVAKDLYKKNQQLEESRAKEEKEKGLKAAEVRGLKRNLED